MTRSYLIKYAQPMPPFIQELREKIRSGKKTQTRRPLVPQPASVRESVLVKSGFVDGHGRELKPKYPAGVRYLREPLIKGSDGLAYYRDDNVLVLDARTDQPVKWRWRNDILTQIFMPREVARFYVGWSVIALQQIQAIAIDLDDIRAEGIQNSVDFLRGDFIHLWDSINKARGFAFADNPYVWAYGFSKYGKGEV